MERHRILFEIIWGMTQTRHNNGIERKRICFCHYKLKGIVSGRLGTQLNTYASCLGYFYPGNKMKLSSCQYFLTPSSFASGVTVTLLLTHVFYSSSSYLFYDLSVLNILSSFPSFMNRTYVPFESERSVCFICQNDSCVILGKLLTFSELCFPPKIAVCLK